MKEKLPKIENIQNPQEFEEKEKGISTIEINGIQIEVKKSFFEYPEHIQKETGILGYERTKISNENIFNLIKEEIQPFLDKYNISSIHDFLSKYKELEKNAYLSNINDDNTKSFNTFNELSHNNVIKEITLKLLGTLSNEEYPDFCYNHELGAYAGEEGIQMKKDFKDDKFFVQKIYDMDRIEKNSLGKNKNFIFNYPSKGDDRSAWSNFNLYDKITGLKIKEKDYIGNLSNYKKDFENDKLFAATPSGGLNMVAGEFWQTNFINYDNVCFGFPINQDSFLKEYTENALDCFLKTEGKDIEVFYKNNKDDFEFRGIKSIIAMYILNEYSLNKKIPSEIYDIYKDEKKLTIFKKEIDEIVDGYFKKRNLKNIFNENNVDIGLQSLGYVYPNGFLSGGEIYLPIFINQEKIPQLCWGHAKYANYYNEQGFNFFEFKHAEHLPVKE